MINQVSSQQNIIARSTIPGPVTGARLSSPGLISDSHRSRQQIKLGCLKGLGGFRGVGRCHKGRFVYLTLKCRKYIDILSGLMYVFSTLVSLAEIPGKNVKCGKVSLKAPIGETKNVRQRETGDVRVGGRLCGIWQLSL